MNDNLDTLRSQIVTNLSDMSAELAASPSLDLNTLLVVAHSTGRTELLDVAYQRIRQIKDPAERAEAYLDLLDEVDYLADDRAEPADNATPPEVPKPATLPPAG